jgi:hypothetical protein
MATVSQLGLELCRGKTLVYSSVFSLNSTFFRVFGTGVRLIPVVRPSCLVLDMADTPHSIAAGLRSFLRGFRGEVRLQLEMVYLRWRRRQLDACGRSWLRDLRAPFSPETLIRAGVAEREAWFLANTPPTPLPADKTRLGGGVPDGWVRVPARSRKERREGARAQEEFSSALLERAWNGDCVPVKVLARETWKETVISGHQSSWQWWRSRFRRLKVSRRKHLLPYAFSSCRAVGVEPTRRSRLPGLRLSGWDDPGRRCNSFRVVACAFNRPVLAPLFEFRLGGRCPKVWLKREETGFRSGLGYT